MIESLSPLSGTYLTHSASAPPRIISIAMLHGVKWMELRITDLVRLSRIQFGNLCPYSGCRAVTSVSF